MDLETLVLEHGAHESRENGVCLMEAVSWFAGEPHSEARRRKYATSATRSARAAVRA